MKVKTLCSNCGREFNCNEEVAEGLLKPVCYDCLNDVDIDDREEDARAESNDDN